MTKRQEKLMFKKKHSLCKTNNRIEMAGRKWHCCSHRSSVVANIYGAEKKFPNLLVRNNKSSRLHPVRMWPPHPIWGTDLKSRPGTFSTISVQEKQIFVNIHPCTSLIIKLHKNCSLVYFFKKFSTFFSTVGIHYVPVIYFILSYFDMLQN